ncbi:MAG: hypothetical protein WCK51_08140 [Armatimonadota bacterium]
MKRKRAFTIAETLTAGGSAVIVGGIAISAFLATTSASSMANARFSSSREIYKLSVMLRNDIEQAESLEVVSTGNIKLNSTDTTTGVASVVEYKLTTSTPPRVQRLVNGTADPQLNTALSSFTFTKINDGCLTYQLNFPATSTEPMVRYKGEVRLRNWIKK